MAQTGSSFLALKKWVLLLSKVFGPEKGAHFFFYILICIFDRNKFGQTGFSFYSPCFSLLSPLLCLSKSKICFTIKLAHLIFRTIPPFHSEQYTALFRIIPPIVPNNANIPMIFFLKIPFPFRELSN